MILAKPKCEKLMDANLLLQHTFNNQMETYQLQYPQREERTTLKKLTSEEDLQSNSVNLHQPYDRSIKGLDRPFRLLCYLILLMLINCDWKEEQYYLELNNLDKLWLSMTRKARWNQRKHDKEGWLKSRRKIHGKKLKSKETEALQL